MSALVRLYPSAWRARYGPEFEALLAQRPPTRRDLVDIVLAAIDARVSPQVGTEATARHAHASDRLAGGAAIAGGLVWFVAFVLTIVTRPALDIGLMAVFALGLMLLSLPGRYLRPHARAVALGTVALGVSVAVLFLEVVPWGPILLLPAFTMLGVLGPGTLALAAVRARIAPRDRRRLLLMTMPWPVLAGTIATFGLLPEAMSGPLLVVSLLPLGVAWIATGVRLALGVAGDVIATSGGTA
jgi:hypothetical protein